MIQRVFFDLGLTLAESDVPQGYVEHLARLGHPVSLEEAQRAYHLANKFFMRERQGALGKGSKEVLRDFLARVCQELGIPQLGEDLFRLTLEDRRPAHWSAFPFSLEVLRGLREVREDAELIAIQDGARPFLTQEVLEEVLSKAEATGAAAPAIPVTDTIKRSENGLAVETLDRDTLFAVQTPQVFEAGLIKAAVQKAVEDGEVLTDDCAAVERLGMKVSLTQGSRENIKITTPLDLFLGEAILDARDGRLP